MAGIDLTPFGFTPTESLVYEVLLTGGPGTGYAIARAAGLARANTYSALEALVSKGAARADDGKPKRYRPESPTALIARITTDQSAALERLGDDLAQATVPSSPTLIEIDTPRAALQLLTHEIARARTSVTLLAPADAYPVLAPSLRRPASSGVALTLASFEAAELSFYSVEVFGPAPGWPGTPLIGIIDDRSAIIAARSDASLSGHWSTSPVFVASARLLFDRFRLHA